MSKDFWSPKSIANRIKAKGLQKLRWYCQMCQKQCRDENGFKCHCTSEGHQRMMKLFSNNTSKYLDDFSRLFEKGFVDLISRRYCSTRVKANTAYQDYIRDKEHIHMNGTRWATLTEFVLYLGEKGICEIELTDKGWYIQYIRRDQDWMEAQKLKEAKEKQEAEDEKKNARMIEKQMRKAYEAAEKTASHSEASELKRENESEPKIAFSLGGSAAAPSQGTKTSPKIAEKPVFVGFEGAEEKEEEKEKNKVEEKKEEKPGKEVEALSRKRHFPESYTSGAQSERKRSALEEILRETESRKATAKRTDYWLSANIVVKILNKQLRNGEFYKKKAIVRRVIDRYVGEVCITGTSTVLRIDQAQLETVIPQLGGKVKILNGGYRGEVCVLKELKVDDFAADLEIAEGVLAGKVVRNVAYEDFSKLA